MVDTLKSSQMVSSRRASCDRRPLEPNEAGVAAAAAAAAAATETETPAAAAPVGTAPAVGGDTSRSDSGRLEQDRLRWVVRVLLSGAVFAARCRNGWLMGRADSALFLRFFFFAGNAGGCFSIAGSCWAGTSGRQQQQRPPLWVDQQDTTPTSHCNCLASHPTAGIFLARRIRQQQKKTRDKRKRSLVTSNRSQSTLLRLSFPPINLRFNLSSQCRIDFLVYSSDLCTTGSSLSM